MKPLLIHSAAMLLPRPSDEEQAALVKDIEKNGLLHPIVVVKDGEQQLILDGISRSRAMLDLGREMGPNDITEIEVADPIAYVLSANLMRRHLSREHKRELIEKLLRLRPEQSDRELAKTVGTGHALVGEIRHALQNNGLLDHSQRVEKTGKKARGQKPKSAGKTSPPPKPIKPAVLTKPGKEVPPDLTNKYNAMLWSWNHASENERRRFLDAVGSKEIIAVASNNLRKVLASFRCSDDYHELPRKRSNQHSGEMPDIPEFLRRNPAKAE